MKLKSIVLAGVLSIAFFSSQAQSENPVIKVLPTTEDGIVKLLVVGKSTDKVEVKFFNSNGLIKTEGIRAIANGFNKKYDVRKILDDGFTMEVTASGASATYTLAEQQGKLRPMLIKESQTYQLVASRN